MRERRRLLAGLLVALCALVLSGCVKLEGETVQQVDAVGDVVLTSRFCTTDNSTDPGNTCPSSDSNGGLQRGTDGNQLLVAYRVPDGVVAPDTVTATYVAPASGSVALVQSPSYASELQRAAPAPAGEHWVGYISPTIVGSDIPLQARVDVTARFGLPRGPGGASLQPSFRWFTAMGGRLVDTTSPTPDSSPDRPVQCGANPTAGFNSPDEEGTVCVDTPKPTDFSPAGEKSANLSDLSVIPGAPVTIAAGSAAFVPFTLRAANLNGAPTFALSTATTVPGATVATQPAFTPRPGDTAMPVGLRVAPGTPAGSYNVTLTAQFAGQLRTATVQINVVPDTQRPRVVVHIARKRLRSVLKNGLRVRVSCDEACRALVKLTGIGTLGSGKATLAAAGSKTVVAKFKQKARKRYAHARSLKLHVKVTAIDLANNRTASVSAVKLKR